MSTSWSAVIKADVGDSFKFLIVRYGTYALLAAYIGLVLFRHSTTEARSIPTAVSSSSADSTENASRIAFDYFSPEGLRMTLSAAFPTDWLNIHYYCAVLLVPAALLQKHFIRKMDPSGAKNKEEQTFYRKNVHPNLGHATVMLMVGMALGGYKIRDVSTFPNFLTAMIYFVAPWAVFIVGIIFTAYYKWTKLHAILGNCVVKSCVAVPLARMLSTALQTQYVANLTTARHTEGYAAAEHQALSDGYYQGILSAAVIIAVWVVVDLIGFLRRLKAQEDDDDAEGKKKVQ